MEIAKRCCAVLQSLNPRLHPCVDCVWWDGVLEPKVKRVPWVVEVLCMLVAGLGVWRLGEAGAWGDEALGVLEAAPVCGCVDEVGGVKNEGEIEDVEDDMVLVHGRG
jgi:hypothetical protein